MTNVQLHIHTSNDGKIKHARYCQTLVVKDNQIVKEKY